MLKWLRKGLRPHKEATAAPVIVPPVAAAAEAAAALRKQGNALLEQGKLTDAAECYRQAVEASPLDSAALLNLGYVLFELQDYAAAEPCLRRAVAADPGSHDAFYFLGSVLLQLGRREEATHAFERALTIQPDFEICLRDLCRLHLDSRNFSKAGELAERGMRLHPNHADFHYYLGTVRHEHRDFHRAEACFRRALELHPDYAHVYNNLGNTLLEQDRMDAAIACYRRAIALLPTYRDAHSNLLFALNYHPDLSAEEIYSAYRQFDEQLCEPLHTVWREHGNDRLPNRRLKVGYVSPDFHQHSVRHFLEPLMSHHDREAVETFTYAEVSGEDAVTARYRRYADHWIPTQGMSDEALAERVRSDGIDILVDLAGHTARNRLGLFARKPSPVSVSWLGYGYTTGLRAIDYLFTDELGVPPGSEHLFSEQPWRLATPGYAFRPAEDMGPVNVLPALERGHVTFGTLTRAIRINHRTVRVWAQILHRVPGSRLVVNSRSYQDPGIRTSLTEKFAMHGIGPERLELGFHSPPWDVLRGIDIGLDCFPHNSGTTLFETLYMGIPFVTLADRPSVGRLGSSILHGVGHPEWIADTEDGYIERAVALATDLPGLAALRSRLRDEMEASPLRDEVAFARKAEEAYRRMFALWAERSSITR